MRPSYPSVKSRQAAIAFILITVMLDVLSFGIIIPVLPKLVENFMSGDTAYAAEIYGLMGTAWALMQFVCAPFKARCPIASDAAPLFCCRTSAWDSTTYSWRWRPMWPGSLWAA